MKGNQRTGYLVYVHTFPNGKKYVGITGKEPNERWKNGKGYQYNKRLNNAIQKYGWENVRHNIVAVDIPLEDASKMEKELIAFYMSNNEEYGYNCSEGGEYPATGSKWTDESRKKRSEMFKGRKLTEEQKRRISEAKKGRPNGRLGMTGALCPKSHLVKQIEEKTGEVIATFYGFDEASRKTGYAKTPMKEAAIGKRKRAYGYLWEVCGGN